jgi:hypothetical protein
LLALHKEVVPQYASIDKVTTAILYIQFLTLEKAQAALAPLIGSPSN